VAEFSDKWKKIMVRFGFFIQAQYIYLNLSLNAMENSANNANLESNLNLALLLVGFLASSGAFVYVLIVIFQLLAVYTQGAAVPENLERWVP
jgi:Zn-dependent membrane protease YugP